MTLNTMPGRGLDETRALLWHLWLAYTWGDRAALAALADALEDVGTAAARIAARSARHGLSAGLAFTWGRRGGECFARVAGPCLPDYLRR